MSKYPHEKYGLCVIQLVPLGDKAKATANTRTVRKNKNEGELLFEIQYTIKVKSFMFYMTNIGESSRSVSEGCTHGLTNSQAVKHSKLYVMKYIKKKPPKCQMGQITAASVSVIKLQ